MNGSQVAEADSDRHAQSRDAGVGSGRTYPVFYRYKGLDDLEVRSAKG